jgi:hypothetical protein
MRPRLRNIRQTAGPVSTLRPTNTPGHTADDCRIRDPLALTDRHQRGDAHGAGDRERRA